MTERGEIETYYSSNHINAIEHHFGATFDDVIVNNNFGLNIILKNKPQK